VRSPHTGGVTREGQLVMARVGHGGANRAYLGCHLADPLPVCVRGCHRAVLSGSDFEVWGVSVPTKGGGPPVTRPTDTRLQDPLVLDEIELYGELVIAASSSDQPLSQGEIDHVLGLDAAGG
jgi:hypothetical protein